MDARKATSKRPAWSVHRHVRTRLTAVLIGTLLTFASALPTWAQISPGDEITPPPETTGWKFTELVSKNHADHAFNPDIATGSGGRQFVAWVETVPNTANRRLFFSQRAAGYGQSWATPALVTEIALEGGWYSMPCPSLACGGSDWVHLVWSVDRSDSAGGIFYRKYNSQTNTWEPATQVVTGQTRGCPRLVADTNDNLHLVWARNDGVYYRPFDKNLNAWLEALRLSQTADTKWAPGIAVSGNGSVHVAWVAGDGSWQSALYYRSRSPGVPWSEVQSLATAKPAPNCTPDRDKDYPASINPSLAAEKDGTVHLAWTQRICRRISVNNVPEGHILYKRYSTAAGWTNEEDISGPRPGGLADRSSTDSALALTTPGLLFWPGSRGQKPVLHVIWREKTYAWATNYTNRILYRNYPSASGPWSEIYEVQKFNEPGQTGGFVEFSRPALSVDSSRTRGVTVHTTWAYRTDLLNSGPDIDVFYRRYVHDPPMFLLRESVLRSSIYVAIIALGTLAAIYGYRRYRSSRARP